MNKHAYLIFAENQPKLLEYQLSLLDHERVDFYIHIDKKARHCTPAQIKNWVKKSGVFFVESTAVAYGTYSQIQCQYALMRTAAKQKYTYYHFLWNGDLPLRTQLHILDFFDAHSGREFVNFYGNTFENGVRTRFHALPKAYDSGFRLFGRKAEKLNCPWSLSSRLNPEETVPTDAGFVLQAGINPCSITHNLVSLILLKESWCSRYLSKMGGVCEVFFQTILWNSMMKQSVFYHRYDDWSSATMRLLNYKDGNPYMWQKRDFDTLIRSPYLFACNVQNEDGLATEIYNHIAKKQKCNQ